MSANNTTCWASKQNPFSKTNQHQMLNLILALGVLTCPFGHIGQCRDNVVNGVYNIEAKGQDIKFVKDMKIGDNVVIPFKGSKDCILARIVSDPYVVDTGLYTTKSRNEIQITNRGDTPFRPVGRKIRIIKTNVRFLPDNRVLGRLSLSRINLSKFPQLVSYIQEDIIQQEAQKVCVSPLREICIYSNRIDAIRAEIAAKQFELYEMMEKALEEEKRLNDY